MKLKATTPAIPASPNGGHPDGSDIPVSHATRYLSAAAHLRRPMLPDEIKDPDLTGPRPPLPVGRSYARRVLRYAEGSVPVTAVDSNKIKKHCRIAVWQTVIRDALAVAVLIVSAVLEPWGTVIILGLVVAAILLVGRIRLFSPVAATAAAGVTLALLAAGDRGERWLTIPLIGLAACFAIYAADILLSAHHVRKIWRQSSAQPTPAAVPAAMPVTRPFTAADRQQPGTGVGTLGNGQTGPAGHANGHAALPENGPDRVYYDKHGIVGAGTRRIPLTLTVPLDKPGEEDQQIRSFRTSDLLKYISAHIVSQGVADERPHGYAYGPAATDDGGEVALPQSRHFTFGLPYLDVADVAADPLPKGKKHPVRRGRILPLRYHSRPSDDDMRGMINRSPSEHPERHYTRIRTSSWDGQLVASLYLNASLQGHFLRLIMRPYILAPVVSDLKFADELAERHPLVIACMAVVITVRQFSFAVERLHRLTAKSGTPGQGHARKSGLHSTREHYAVDYIENMHQAEDANRIVAILEQKIFRVTMDFLKNHNIDIGEYEKQVLNYFVQYNNSTTGNIITGGNITDSPVTSGGGAGT
jgi:hypothetical protein